MSYIHGWMLSCIPVLNSCNKCRTVFLPFLQISPLNNKQVKKRHLLLFLLHSLYKLWIIKHCALGVGPVAYHVMESSIEPQGWGLWEVESSFAGWWTQCRYIKVQFMIMWLQSTIMSLWERWIHFSKNPLHVHYSHKYIL